MSPIMMPGCWKSEHGTGWRFVMERRKANNEIHEAHREIILAVQQILAESIEEKDRYIAALEEEIRHLRGVISELHIDARFWIGLPTSLRKPDEGARPEKTAKS